MKVAKAKGRLRGKQSKLSANQEAHLVALYRAGDHTIGDGPPPKEGEAAVRLGHCDHWEKGGGTSQRRGGGRVHIEVVDPSFVGPVQDSLSPTQ